MFVRNQPARLASPLHQALDLGLGEDATGRVEPDAVVRGQEIEEGGPARGQRQPGGPGGERPRAAGLERVEDEGRQGKVVDQLGLVRPVAEVGEIVRVGDVGLGDQPDARRKLIQDGAKELDDPVGLRQVDAGGADLLPKVGDGIQTDELGPWLT